MRKCLRAGFVAIVVSIVVSGGAAWGQTVLVQAGSSMSYLANQDNPGIGLQWVQPGFDDSAWETGTYGVGFETSPPGATALLNTTVPSGTSSIFTRARFTVANPGDVSALVMGADFDDGWAAWLNGVEVYRSPQLPSGALTWNSHASSHESSNGSTPNYGTMNDISLNALPALQAGENVLAVAVWNNGASSSDLVLVPRLETAIPALTRGPYLQMGSPTSIVVRWRTSTATSSRVLYGASPAALGSSATLPEFRMNHEVILTGLNPGADYYYAVGTTGTIFAGGDASHRFQMAPPAGDRGPKRIWVLGDSGTGTAGQRAVRDAYYSFAGSVTPDLWLMLGDNAYEDGTDSEFQSKMFDIYPQTLRTSVLWPTVGNHDAHTADSLTQTGPYFDIFSLPRQAEAGGEASGTEAYYSFDYGNIHFVCLESQEIDNDPGSAMITWLEQDLAATSQEWVIAFWHHPPYSKGSHNSDGEAQLIAMRENALPILEAAGVDLVMTGHSHSYERSFLLDGHYGVSGTLAPSMIVDGGDGRVDGDGAYLKNSGPPLANGGAVQVVAGSSGQISGGTLNHPVMVVSLNVLGSLVLDVNGSQLDATFLDSTGQVRDHFTLYKGAAGPPEADFEASPAYGPAPLAISFTDQSAGPVSLRKWDFQNNGSVDSTRSDPVFTYTQTGPHAVRLEVFGAGGSDQTVKAGAVCVYPAGGAGDLDGDGAPDGSDCAPCNASASAMPPQAGSIVMGPGNVVSWTAPPQGAATNLYRGTGVSGFPWTHVCLAGGLTGTGSSDSAVPAVGGLFYYVLSLENACGEGSLGTGTSGSPRPNSNPCP